MADASTAATAATAAAGGGSSWFSPQLVSSLVQLAPALFQRKTGRDQAKEAEKMQQALGPRVAYGIPQEAKRALGIAEDIARPREMAGQNYMQYMMDLENAKTLGRASKAATSSQDLLGVITQLGEAGQEGQLKLGVTAAEDYNKRQQILQSALGNMAAYQDKVTADKQKDWYERAAAAAAMKGASMQNRMGGLQGLTQAAVQFLGSDAASQLFGNIGAKERSRQQTLEKIDNMNALSSDGEEGVIDPAGYTPPSMTDKQMLDITGMTPAPASGYFSADSIPGMGMQTQLPVNQTGLMQRQTTVNMPSFSTSNYGNITGDFPGAQVPPSTNPYQMGAYGQTFPMVNMPMFSTSNYGNITGNLPGSQVPPSTNPYQMGVYGQTPSSVGSLFNLFNTFY